MTEEEVFLAALDLPDATARAAYLDETCGDNAELRRQVGALLAAHFRTGDFLNVPVAEQVHAGAKNDNTVAVSGDAVSAAEGHEEESNDLPFLSPSTRPDSLGRLGHYEMLQVLGRGGFGIVFRAFDDMLQRVVAVKVMAPQIATLSPARKRFLREARSSAAIRHENVVQVYEVGEQPLPYLVMEFVPGETLQQKLDRMGPLEVPEVLRIGRQIAEGLAAAHACDLIHRDIKPGNVLLEGGSHKAKITDFGLARAADDASISQSGIIAGTPMFMSPEQALGNKLDQRADLFSLGSVLYQMVSGRPPFRAPSALAVLKRVAEETPRPIPEIIPETPEWLCGIITKLHAKNPDERYQSAREVADLLADCEAKLKAKQEVKNVLPAAVKPAGRKWVAAAAVLLLPVIALAVTEFVGVTHLFRGQQGMRDPIKPDNGWTTRVDDAWLKQVAAMPAEQQVDAVTAKLKDLNPGFDGKVTHKIEDGVVTELRFLTDKVANISPIQVFNHLRVLDCSGTPTLDWRGTGQLGDLNLLKGMNVAGLVELNLMWTEVSDAGLAHFKDCKNLTKLGLASSKVSDAGLALFKDCKSLTWLSLDRTQVSDAGLALFKDCKNLTYLNLYGTKVGDAGLANFKDCKNLAVLCLIFTRVSDGGLAHFKDCKNLTMLHLQGTKVGDVGLAHLKDCKKLEVLNLPLTQVGDAGLAYFKDCKSLTYLALYGNTQVSDTGLAYFKDCKNLRTLGLTGTKVSDEGLANLVDCKNLTHLELDGTRVGDAGVAHLKNCKDLTLLMVRKTKVTAAMVEELRKALPGCKIEWDGGGSEPLPPTFKNNIGMQFVIVPKGKSWLGGSSGKLGDKEVEIPGDFYLGKYEVTQEEWQRVMGENPSSFSRKGQYKADVKDIPDAELKRFPVESVSWNDCRIFVGRLNSLAKETGWVYRLPKEAEWEYACRGGPMADKADSAFDFYFARPTNNLLPEQANFKHDKWLQQTRKVGSYAPNRLGLFDMHGNVVEWCEEHYPQDANSRVVRGGGWHSDSGDVRAARQGRTPELERWPYHGLRLARVPSAVP